MEPQSFIFVIKLLAQSNISTYYLNVVLQEKEREEPRNSPVVTSQQKEVSPQQPPKEQLRSEEAYRNNYEDSPILSAYYNKPSIYPLELQAGSHSENYHRSAYISKKKKVVKNPFLKDLGVYRVSSEPCLQKKRITMYPKNHNILRTSKVKEEVCLQHNCVL